MSLVMLTPTTSIQTFSEVRLNRLIAGWSCSALLAAALSAATLVAVSAPAATAAERYVDRSGLTPGRFVWDPTRSASGPVFALVSRPNGIVHIYRNGIEIGFAKGRVQQSAAPPAMSLFTSRPRTRRDGRTGFINGLFGYSQAKGTAVERKGTPPLRVSPVFMRLLGEAAANGLTVVTANEASRPRIVRMDWLSPPSRRLSGLALAASEASRLGGPALAPEPPGRNVLVISGADKTATLYEAGVAAWTSPVTISRADEPLSTHVFAKLDDPSGRGLGMTDRWLVTALSDQADADHLSQRQARQMLARVRFMDRVKENAAATALSPAGSVIILSDEAWSGASLGAGGVELLEASLRIKQPRLAPRRSLNGTTRARPRKRSRRATRAPQRQRAQRRPFGPRDLPGMD